MASSLPLLSVLALVAFVAAQSFDQTTTSPRPFSADKFLSTDDEKPVDPSTVKQTQGGPIPVQPSRDTDSDEEKTIPFGQRPTLGAGLASLFAARPGFTLSNLFGNRIPAIASAQSDQITTSGVQPAASLQTLGATQTATLNTNQPESLTAIQTAAQISTQTATVTATHSTAQPAAESTTQSAADPTTQTASRLETATSRGRNVRDTASQFGQQRPTSTEDQTGFIGFAKPTTASSSFRPTGEPSSPIGLQKPYPYESQAGSTGFVKPTSDSSFSRPERDTNSQTGQQTTPSAARPGLIGLAKPTPASNPRPVRDTTTEKQQKYPTRKPQSSSTRSSTQKPSSSHGTTQKPQVKPKRDTTSSVPKPVAQATLPTQKPQTNNGPTTKRTVVGGPTRKPYVPKPTTSGSLTRPQRDSNSQTGQQKPRPASAAATTLKPQVRPTQNSQKPAPTASRPARDTSTKKPEKVTTQSSVPRPGSQKPKPST